MQGFLPLILCLSQLYALATSAYGAQRPSSSILTPRNYGRLDLSKRDLWVPRVTSPDALSIWTTGSQQTVTWDLSDMPPGKENDIGLLLLGYFTGNASSGENLNLNNPLDSSVPLGDGKVTITVPDNLETRISYIVVLIGDSGDASPAFTIINPVV